MTRYLATKPDFSKEGVVSHDWLFTQVLPKEGVTMECGAYWDGDVGWDVGLRFCD